MTLFLASCYKKYYTSAGSIRPAKNRFYISKMDLTTNSKIDTGFLYMTIQRNMYLGSGKSGELYQFYRFFSNGQLQISNSYKSPDDYHDFLNISSGLAGYYKLTADTLLCEFFAPTNGGEYIFIDGFVDGSKIILKRQYPRNGVHSAIKTNDTLVRTHINATFATPDW